MNFPTSRRPTLVWVVIAAALALSLAAAIPVLNGRTSAPAVAADVARNALLQAREGDAAEWAPEALRESEVALREALAEYRRQEVRLLPLRNFHGTRERLDRATLLAREAATAAGQARVAAEREAASACGIATEELQRAESLAASVPLGSMGRSHLAQARTLLGEATHRMERGEFVGARELAQRAIQEAARASAGAVGLAERYRSPDEIRRWRNWIDSTIEASRRSGGPAIVVIKERHLLTLYVAGRSVRQYPADMGQNRMAAKLQAGDNATPEGRYRVVSKKGRGQSKYYKALLLDYPSEEDRRRLEEARRQGRVSRRAHPGSLIEIHGDGGRGQDWTNGCVAVSNPHMDDLFNRVPVGTPVTIVGGDGRSGTFSDIARNNGGAAQAAEP